MIIGVDIGGTHTDAVLVDRGKIAASVKVLNGEKLEEGFRKAVGAVMHPSVKQIKVGTTHADQCTLG